MEADKYAESVMAKMHDDMLKGEYRLDPRTFKHYLAMAWLDGRYDGFNKAAKIAVNAIERKPNVISQG